MTLIWLIAWLLFGAPFLTAGWVVLLVVCLLIDINGVRRA